MENRQLNFDVARGGVQHRLSVCVGDTKSRTVTARFFSGSEPVPLTAAYLRGLRADGKQIYAACTVEGSAATYTFTTSDLSVGGTLMCEFDLHNGDAVMTSPRFAVLCGKPVYTGEGAEGSNEYAAYIAALLKLENLTVTAEAGDTAAATVTVGDTAVQLHFVLPKGEDGYTPERGVDYWTKNDEDAMTAAKNSAARAAGNANSAAETANGYALEAQDAARNANAAAAKLQAKADAGDFNGAPGAKGDKGDKGDPGADGYTPVRGTDYWTDADKAAINADIAAQVAGKVDKIDGKGLSANDYTDADKAKVGLVKKPIYVKQVESVGYFFNPETGTEYFDRTIATDPDAGKKYDFFLCESDFGIGDMVRLTVSQSDAFHLYAYLPQAKSTILFSYVNDEGAADADLKFDVTITDDFADKVDKVDGKGLSTNDYTDADKAAVKKVISGEIHTPVRGTDYWTAEDIAAIKGYVDTAILGGAW